MVISVASQKGGTGKTSTSISLAAGLAHKGKHVLLIDIDSQANSSKVLLHDYPKVTKEQTIYATILTRSPLVIHQTHVPNLSLVPSHILLSNTDIELTTAKDHRESRLKTELDKVKDGYDYVFIDNPPALGWLTLNAFTASDQVLVVVSPGYFELDSLVQLGKTLDEVREYFNPGLELLGYLFTMSEPTINAATSLQILRQTYTQKVLRTVIPRNTDLRDAHFDDHAMAEHLAEAARRAWPELAIGAPTFENILKHSVIVLRENHLSLTALADLLTDRPWRDALLRRVSDPQVVRFFHHRVDQWGRDEAAMKESTLNRADLLTLSPVLRHSLGQRHNCLDFRRVLDSGTSVIINLGGLPPDTRRLLGCLLTVGMEAAALSRADVRRTPGALRRSHHLLIDEFSQFMAHSEESLTRMLSETRKYGLFCVMAHQNWSQASQRLKGALQNVGLEVIFKAGRADAEYSARLLGVVDPLSVKHTVADEAAAERTHPAFFSLPEQWERHTQAVPLAWLGIGVRAS